MFFFENWDTLTEIQDFLKIFHDTTFDIESIFNAINKMFFVMEYFLKHFEI